MDVASWLRSLGLEQYEAVLRENEVDESVLPDLTEDHLRELGFPLGARLKILKAIGVLHSNKNSALPPMQLHRPHRARPPKTAPSAAKSP
jgi:SAM domain (Sterile alpha motif)